MHVAPHKWINPVFIPFVLLAHSNGKFIKLQSLASNHIEWVNFAQYLLSNQLNFQWPELDWRWCRIEYLRVVMMIIVQLENTYQSINFHLWRLLCLCQSVLVLIFQLAYIGNFLTVSFRWLLLNEKIEYHNWMSKLTIIYKLLSRLAKFTLVCQIATIKLSTKCIASVFDSKGLYLGLFCQILICLFERIDFLVKSIDSCRLLRKLTTWSSCCQNRCIRPRILVCISF